MAESCGDCYLLDVFRVDRDLMVSSHQINLGRGGAAGKAVGVVLYVWDWIPVMDGPCVKSSVVSTRPPTAVLRHEMEVGRQWALGASGSAGPQYGVEIALATAKRSAAMRRGRQATGGPGVVRM